MRDKLVKYAGPEGPGEWPLTGYVLDPVRASIVCNDAHRILQVMRWFTEGEEGTGLPVCRLKNKFAWDRAAAEDGYRDLTLNVIVTGDNGLRIIGEIQIHDACLFDLKRRMHKLYKVKRATDPLKL